MAMDQNIVSVTGNLTRDPEMGSTPGGTAYARLRVAVNDRIKGSDGQWSDRVNYFDATCWSNQAENVGKYLAKGSKVLIEGSLQWREWKAEDGTGRQAVSINARRVMFIGAPKGDGSGGGGSGGGGRESQPTPDDDDIPF